MVLIVKSEILVKKYQEYLDYYIFDPLNGEDYLYYGFLEPAYNGTFCDNYVKVKK